MRPDQNAPVADDLSGDPDDDELPIDLLNDSFFLDSMARIMADARSREIGVRPKTEGDSSAFGPL